MLFTGMRRVTKPQSFRIRVIAKVEEDSNRTLHPHGFQARSQWTTGMEQVWSGGKKVLIRFFGGCRLDQTGGKTESVKLSGSYYQTKFQIFVLNSFRDTVNVKVYNTVGYDTNKTRKITESILCIISNTHLQLYKV